MFLYDILTFKLLFIFYFSMNLVVFYVIFYNDVTHVLTDHNENRTAYVKLEIKDILFVRIF